MMNNFWALHREITQNNGSSRPIQPDSQTRNNHQSTNGYLTTPQTMLQRPQNHLMGVNNFNQERYQRNNNVDVATLSMRNFPFSANNNTSFMTAARYGRALPLGYGLTSSPQQHLSSPNTTLLSSYHSNLARNSSSNIVGSQGFANWSRSRNPSRPIIQNQRNFRYLPYVEGSNRRNNSFLFNDFNLRPSGNTNRFHSVYDGSIPSATPPPFSPINNNDLNMFISSGNANWDSTRDTSTSHRVFNIRDTDVWRRPMTPPDNCYEAIQTEKKELLLFKDTIPTSSVTEADDANDDDEHLDLSLHL